jgi:hypothetical protein
MKLVPLILCSTAGSLLSYFAVICTPSSKNSSENTVISRLNVWKKMLNYDKRLIIWDLFIMVVLLGLCYTVFIMEPTTHKQAFFSGLTAEGFFFQYINSARGKRI